jgi:hypothetical protein
VGAAARAGNVPKNRDDNTNDKIGNRHKLRK